MSEDSSFSTWQQVQARLEIQLKGKRRNQDTMEIAAFLALCKAGGTIHLDAGQAHAIRPRSPLTLGEWVAHTYPLNGDGVPVSDPGAEDRIVSMHDHAYSYIRAFRTLADTLLDLGVVLYITPASLGSSRVEVITCDANYAPSPQDGATVAEIRQHRDGKLARGALEAACKRAIPALGAEETRRRFFGIVADLFGLSAPPNSQLPQG